MPNPICSTNCIDALPPARFPGCGGQGAYVKESEISRILIGKSSRTPFNNWLDPAEWVGLVDNAGTADTDQTLRVYEVIGDMPAGSPVTKVISRKRTLTITKNRTISWTVDIITQETYDGMRIYECGGTYPIWLETYGGMFYGGNSGILLSIDPNLILGRGDATEEIVVTGSYQSKFMPERGPSPIFEGELDEEDGGDGENPDTTVYTNVVSFDSNTSGVATAGTKGGLTFVSGSGSVAATNANQKVEFETVANTGGPLQISIKENGVTKMNIGGFGGLVSSGNRFRYTDTAGTEHTQPWAATINITV